jgi:hypothetical protein
MLAPLRDYLSPKDPKSSPLLCATKEQYFTRMSVHIDPNEPNFDEARWFRSEDINVEHLLDVFSTVDANSDSVWAACVNFMEHLFWHKRRPTILKAKIEGLSDDHCFKPECLVALTRLFYPVSNDVESKRLLSHALKLERERGNDRQVARILRRLSETNRIMGLHGEGIQQVEEASEICGRLGDAVEQAHCLITLIRFLRDDKQFDAAEEAALRAIDLVPGRDELFLVCHYITFLAGYIDPRARSGKPFTISRQLSGLRLLSTWHHFLFGIHSELGALFLHECRLDDANAHLERAKSHAVDNTCETGLGDVAAGCGLVRTVQAERGEV